jgi:DNA-binding response OmpR family regulator
MTGSNLAFRPDYTESSSAPAGREPVPIRESPSVDLLLIHSDFNTQGLLTATLSAAGHEVSTSSSVDGAIRLLRDDSFEVVVLSLRIAESDGVAMVRRIRSVSDVPLIVLGDEADPAVRNAVFDSGADDYLVNLADASELDRLVRARARRAGSRGRGYELKGPSGLVMHVRAHEVFVGTERLPLTPKEFAILRLLLEHRAEVVETDQMAINVWGHQTYGSRNFVEAHISRLRQKLSKLGAGSAIATVRGIGYVIR